MIEYALPFTNFAVGTKPSNTQVVSSMFSKLSRLKVSCRSTLPSPRWRKLAARTQFKILFTSPTQHYCALPPSLLERGNGGEDSTVPPVPQFKIPFALFRAHYRLKKRLSLWYIKENSRVVLLYCVDF